MSLRKTYTIALQRLLIAALAMNAALGYAACDMQPGTDSAASEIAAMPCHGEANAGDAAPEPAPADTDNCCAACFLVAPPMQFSQTAELPHQQAATASDTPLLLSNQTRILRPPITNRS